MKPARSSGNHLSNDPISASRISSSENSRNGGSRLPPTQTVARNLFQEFSSLFDWTPFHVEAALGSQSRLARAILSMTLPDSLRGRSIDDSNCEIGSEENHKKIAVGVPAEERAVTDAGHNARMRLTNEEILRLQDARRQPGTVPHAASRPTRAMSEQEFTVPGPSLQLHSYLSMPGAFSVDGPDWNRFNFRGSLSGSVVSSVTEFSDARISEPRSVDVATNSNSHLTIYGFAQPSSVVGNQEPEAYLVDESTSRSREDPSVILPSDWPYRAYVAKNQDHVDDEDDSGSAQEQEQNLNQDSNPEQDPEERANKKSLCKRLCELDFR